MNTLMSTTTSTGHNLSVWYTPEEIERYTKHLAELGITDEKQVAAVLEYIHRSVCIALRIVKKNGLRGT